jgi:hypothetical protein
MRWHLLTPIPTIHVFTLRLNREASTIPVVSFGKAANVTSSINGTRAGGTPLRPT